MNNQRAMLRTLTRSAYDMQKLRIQMGLRVVSNFKAKLGQAPGEKEEELDAEALNILEELRTRYDRITDGVVGLPKMKAFEGDDLISEYAELVLIHHYVTMEKSEREQFKYLVPILAEFTIYRDFLDKVNGCGPLMSAVIISEFDIHRAKYPSSLWRYAGLDVGPDGTGRSRRKEHLVESTYTDKDGNEKTKMGISFNPWLKTKLIGVLAGCFLRAGENPYRAIYLNYKNRLENHAVYGKSKDKDKMANGTYVGNAKRHAMAMRYMIKRFLVDLYVAWRTIEGLPVNPEYSEAKLQMVHGTEVVAA